MSGPVLPELAMAATVVAPMVGALTAPFMRRNRQLLAMLAGLVTAAAAAVLLSAILTEGPYLMELGGWPAPLGIRWRADLIAALFLTTTAFIGLMVAWFASDYLPGSHPEIAARFWSPFLLLWTALNALFLSGDAFNLYVTLELLTLAAVLLVALEGNRDALNGAMLYLLVALAGSAAYLLGVAFLYHGAGTLDLVLAGERMAAPVLFGVALMSTGLMAKGALFPLHAWLPPAHSAAPAPGSALLSGLVVKGAFYVLLRLWLELVPDQQAGRQLLGLFGAAAVVWGSLLALRQERLKLVIAYSTVAQLGYLLLLFPLAQGVWAPAAFAGGIYLALAHGLAKASMFLSAGLVIHALGHDRVAGMAGLATAAPMTVFTMALAGLTLMGLPPSGGFTAKWLLLEAALGTDQWLWALVLLGGGLLSAAYVFRVLAAAFGEGQTVRTVPRRLEWVPLVLAGTALTMGLAAQMPVQLLHEAAP